MTATIARTGDGAAREPADGVAREPADSAAREPVDGAAREPDAAHLGPVDTAYLPGVLVDWLRSGQGGDHRTVDGTLVLADVSGFTALTERLARSGQVGAEEINDLLSEVFSGLLDVAAGHGGRLVKWCGDAVLLLYDGPEHAARACRASWDMRAAMGRLGQIRTSVGRARLRLSVGVHSGPVDLYLVGDSHRELIAVGPAAGGVVRAQSYAPTGEIAVSDATATLLDPGTTDDSGLVRRRPGERGERGERGEAGPGQQGSLPRQASPPQHGTPPQQGTPSQQGPFPRQASPLDRDVALPAAPYLSTELRARRRAGDTGSEHRLVAVAFLEFAGVDTLHARSGPDAVLAAVDAVVRRAQTACDRYHVTFLETDISEHGGRIMMVAGAPRRYGRDTERLLRAVHEVMDGGGALTLRAGVNAGRVFTGDLGPAWQRTYSVKGDAVNLAARVMQHAAPGQLLATAGAVESGHTLRVEAVPEFAVKGKTAPVQAFSVLGTDRVLPVTATGASPWYGREAELSQLRDLLARARSGHGTTLVLDGPPGIGKSRLVAEFLRRAGAAVAEPAPAATAATEPVPAVAAVTEPAPGAAAATVPATIPAARIPTPRSPDGATAHSGTGPAEPLTVVQVGCDTAVVGTAYALAERLLRAVLTVPADASAAQAADVLASAVRRRTPELTGWLPLLASVLRVDLPPTDEVAALAVEFRKARLEQLLVAVLTALLPDPTVLVVDDAHLADSASADLLARLAQGADGRPWLMLWCATGMRIADGVPVQRMSLTGLAAADIAALLSEQVTGSALLPHQRAAIAARAEGNPLFLRELTRLVGRTADPTDLPDSVEGVLAAEVDRLDPADRSLLRAAAVSGMRVDPSLVAQALGEPVREERWARLSAFLDPDTDGTLRFRHGLIQEAAYQGLPHRSRRHLHLALGLAMQRRPGTNPDAQAEALSAHFFAAGDYASAAHYARVAGERAAAVYANPEAATLLQRAWDAARRLRPTIPEEVARLAETCGDIYYRLGDFAAARHAFDSARPLVHDDTVGRARLCLKSAQVVARTSGFPKALAWITRGRRLLAGSDDPQALRQDARLLVQIALLRQMEGRPDEAERACELAIAASRRTDAPDVLGQALQLRDAADVARGRFGGEPWAEQALRIWQQRGDLGWQARALNQLGIRAYFTARWDDALAHYEQAAAAFSRVGDEFNAAIASCNVAEILSDQGHQDRAEPMARAALEVLHASAALSETAFAHTVVGRAAQRQARFAEARRHFQAALDAYATAGERGEIAATDLRLAECALSEGRAADAVAEAGRVAAPGADPGLRAAAARLRGHALAMLGDPAAARIALSEALDLARRSGSRYDELLARDALARLDRARPDRAEHRENVSAAAELARRLGVVTVPTLPLPGDAVRT